MTVANNSRVAAVAPASVVDPAKLTRIQARERADAARREFAQHMALLDDKLNVAKQANIRIERTKRQLRDFAKNKPGAAKGVAIAAASAVALAIWLIIRRRR